ncbi:MAG: ABC transporter substrate-binding protein [Actinomycetota bacterium]|nr:ABC transporter substrate-binding protein [Actinomycetota bacterium]
MGTNRRRHALLLPVLLLVVGLAACGDDDDAAPAESSGGAGGSTTTADAPDATATPETTAAPEATGENGADDEIGRVLAIGEETVLADLLAIGVRPIASTATVPEVGFQGMGDLDTSGIEPLSATEPNYEYLATLEPDIIVTYEFWADIIGEDILDSLAAEQVIALEDNLPPEERVAALGDALGRTDEAAEVVAELTAARDEVAGALGPDCELSMATVYPGPSVAVWVEGRWEMQHTIIEAGCTLAPDASQTDPDDNGRAWVSDEQWGLLSATPLVLFQNENVDGEAEALATVEADPLWQQVPAVEAGEVVVFDRLGYPGAVGQVRFIDELLAELG